MTKSKIRKQRPNISIDEYLHWCQEDISLDEYFEFEKVRAKALYKVSPIEWINIIRVQSLKCFYCDTDLQLIQRLILENIIKPRKRGPDRYSGLHFELDHKNANKKDNRFENIVASCYYCNNDKSNTFDSAVFKKYFGANKNIAFKQLCIDNNLRPTDKFRHHLKGMPKRS